jgi:hypothetical protein
MIIVVNRDEITADLAALHAIDASDGPPAGTGT